MGYTPSTGPKGLDTFNSTPQTVADFQRLVTLIARMGNLREGATSERDALSGTALYEGLHFYDKTLKRMLKYSGTGWVEAVDDTGWQPLTLNSGWSAQPPDVIEYRVADGFCEIVGRVDATTGAGTLLGTLPVGARPTRAKVMHIQDTSGTAVGFVVSVNIDGTIIVLKGGNAVNDLPLSAIPPFRVR